MREKPEAVIFDLDGVLVDTAVFHLAAWRRIAKELGFTFDDGIAESLKGVVSQVLCKKIGGGRVAAREILLVTPAISNLIREGKTYQIPSIMQTSKRLGMITMNDTLFELVESKQVEPKEAYMRSVDKTSFINKLRERGFDTSFVEADPLTAPASASGAPGQGAPAKPGAAGVRR